MDLKGVGISVIAQWTPAVAKKVTSCLEKAMPARQRATHILNTPTGFEAAYTIFRKLLSDKFKKRVSTYPIPSKINDDIFDR